MSFLGGSRDVDDVPEVRPGVLVDYRPVPNTVEDLTEIVDGSGVIATATTMETAGLICRALNYCYEQWLKSRRVSESDGLFERHWPVGKPGQELRCSSCGSIVLCAPCHSETDDYVYYCSNSFCPDHPTQRAGDMDNPPVWAVLK